MRSLATIRTARTATPRTPGDPAGVGSCCLAASPPLPLRSTWRTNEQPHRLAKRRPRANACCRVSAIWLGLVLLLHNVPFGAYAARGQIQCRASTGQAFLGLRDGRDAGKAAGRAPQGGQSCSAAPFPTVNSAPPSPLTRSPPHPRTLPIPPHNPP